MQQEETCDNCCTINCWVQTDLTKDLTNEEHYRFGDMIKFMCNFGYVMTGNPSLLCTTGSPEPSLSARGSTVALRPSRRSAMSPSSAMRSRSATRSSNPTPVECVEQPECKVVKPLDITSGRIPDSAIRNMTIYPTITSASSINPTSPLRPLYFAHL